MLTLPDTNNREETKFSAKKPCNSLRAYGWKSSGVAWFNTNTREEKGKGKKGQMAERTDGGEGDGGRRRGQMEERTDGGTGWRR